MLIVYTVLGFSDGFGTINPLIWLWIILLFVAGYLLLDGKWNGCLIGIAIGFVFIYMSTQETGQALNVEFPFGIILCSYYAIVGYMTYRANR